MSRRTDEPLITIATFEDSIEARLARGALEAIGIRALVPEFANARLDVRAKLQVFQSDSVRAQTELRRLQIRIVRSTSDE
jgi:hypothetical protein